MNSYRDFCESKMSHTPTVGIESPNAPPDWLFPFQRDIVSWAWKRGRSALFADTGLGKSAMQIAWADYVARFTGGRVLILAPLAVSHQTSAEASRFGLSATVIADQSEAKDRTGVFVSNYEKLHKLDPSSFSGVVLDESSILKNYTSSTRNALNAAFARTPFKLCCTATPAPNDFTELGNHAQFLGVRTREEMLAEFFVHDGGSTQDWRIKGHARDMFWRWVASWACVVRRPSDLGYNDGGFALPELVVREHVVPLGVEFARRAGVLFDPSFVSLSDQREVRRASIPDRVAKIAELVANEPDHQWLIWCDLNDEGDAIERAIPGAVQVAGRDSDDDKSSRMLGFANGSVRVLVSKPGICGYGMNFQRASRMAFVGVSHSFEDFYQAVRREWRFGQTVPVHVHVVCTDGDRPILENLKRKESEARAMAESAGSTAVEMSRSSILAMRNEKSAYVPTARIAVPSWLEAS